jgi:hypothetical protein
MSTQTLHEAARLMEQNILLDSIQIYDVSDPITVGAEVTRALTPVGPPVQGLVQSVSLELPLEGRISQSYVIKVSITTALEAGQAVRLLNSRTEADLVGKTFMIDTVSASSIGTIRKATSSKVATLDSQGKGVL